MSDLVDRFEQMGLANFLQYRCDWNETVIRQFYTTLEINMVEFSGQLARELIMLPLLSLPLQINWTMILLQVIKVSMLYWRTHLMRMTTPCTMSPQMLVLLEVWGGHSGS